MSVDFNLSKVGVNEHNRPQVPHTIIKGSIVWKTMAVVGLIMAGIPTTQASCDSVSDIIKFSVIKPTLAWMFPELARNERPMPLNCVLYELGEICPVHNICPIEITELEEQSLRINAAMFQVSQDGDRTAYRIKHFGIKDQSSVIKILQQSIDGSLSIQPVIFLIKRCYFTNEADRISLARSAVKASSGFTLEHFNDFEIFKSKTANQSALISFVEFCIELNPIDTAVYFKNFEVRDPDDRFRLAKLCAQKDPIATADFIKNFDLKNEKNEEEIVAMNLG